MARTKAKLGEGARLSDYLCASLLARVYPPQQVHAALDAHDANSKRLRRFPAVAGVYYTMALSLYSEAALEEVFAVVSQGLAWAGRAGPPRPVSKSSISGLRSRIGSQPLRDLLRACCVPLAEPAQLPQAFYAGLRLMAIDGSRIELADEAAIAEAFGRPGSRTGVAGYPQAQCVVLAECATHAIVAAELGPYRGDEWELCRWLLGALEPGMLLLADRGFNGWRQWHESLDTGAQLLWRATESRHLPVHTPLSDGSYLSTIEPTGADRREPGAVAHTVRVIEYQLRGVSGAAQRYRLVTSLLDPRHAPAQELAALYHQRWQVEAVFDELKTHLRQGRRVLRSKTPELVRQEFFGWALAHYAVRWLLHQGAAHSGQLDEELSFTAHVQLLRRQLPRSGAFPPTAAPQAQALVR